MSQDIEQVERIERYILHSMKEEERAAMERELHDNPSLASQVEQQKLVHELVIGNRLNQLKGMMESEFFSEEVPRNVLPKRLTLISFALLVTIGVVGILVVRNSKHSNEPLKEKAPINNKKIDTITSFKKEEPKGKYNIGSTGRKNKVVSKDSQSTIQPLKVPMVDTKGTAISANVIQDVKSVSSKPLPLVVEKPIQKEPSPVQVNPILPEKKVETITKTEKIVSGETISFSPTNGETAMVSLEPDEEVQVTITNRAGIVIWKTSSIGQDKMVWEGNDSSNGISVPGLYLYTLEYKSGKKIVGKIVVY